MRRSEKLCYVGVTREVSEYTTVPYLLPTEACGKQKKAFLKNAGLRHLIQVKLHNVQYEYSI